MTIGYRKKSIFAFFNILKRISPLWHTIKDQNQLIY